MEGIVSAADLQPKLDSNSEDPQLMSATKDLKVAPASLNVDAEEAKRFKLALIGKEAMTAQVFSDDPQSKARSKILHGTFAQLEEQLSQLNASGLDIAMCVHRTDGEGRKEANVVEIRCFVLDDDKDAGAPKEFPLCPHLTIKSSRRRFHYYWFVKDCPVDRYEQYAHRLAAKYGGDTNSTDVSRAMHMPGFRNHKHAPPYRVRIIEDN